MRKLAIYEAAAEWDDEQELADLAQSLDVLTHQGVEWERHDLAKEPAAFEANPAAAQYLKVFGAERLPVMLVDGVIVIAGRYPDDVDLIDWLELPPEVLGYEWADVEDLKETHGGGNGSCREHEHERRRHHDGCGCHGHEHYAEDGLRLRPSRTSLEKAAAPFLWAGGGDLSRRTGSASVFWLEALPVCFHALILFRNVLWRFFRHMITGKSLRARARSRRARRRTFPARASGRRRRGRSALC